jgi:hypothetical protein
MNIITSEDLFSKTDNFEAQRQPTSALTEEPFIKNDESN